MEAGAKESALISILAFAKKEFENYLESEVYPRFQKEAAPELAEAMEYSIKAGGKRLRPILAMAAFGALTKDSLSIAGSLEFLHTYSLIHDDLPSMDNDDFRRGIQTLHKRYSEATAILAGDALQAYAFEWLTHAKAEVADPHLYRDLIRILHQGGGAPGMVSGQVFDLALERNPSSLKGNKEELLAITHRLKTGALIRASLLLGNRLRQDHQSRAALLSDYGIKLGLLFQITDDILDVEGTREDLGKTPGKDDRSGKITYPALYGLDECKKMVTSLVTELEGLGKSLDNSFSRDGAALQFPDFFQLLPGTLGSRKN
ncbi:putative geranyltranstransferase [Leptospira inadai serovar Lyme str. 10]|uniref:Geranylgeranyl pyrophosphate synthase n=2 Tax=Leptospira inadai serovar Lyme TaxID=293084 RepID=A0ABX4YLL0_9LEPT|nr:farnesyl diphosphate synthase [Leptospira inadai]EQA35517.1 putative geranyltranstransferase [Leptospira inadai serovar Lyme str. 10]PNV76165.1 geranylgeranyl pyrophosphate synthase [Leptospira inadai serovar Lyme]